MVNEKLIDVNGSKRRALRAAGRHPGDSDPLLNTEHVDEPQEPQPDPPFPYLEDVIVAAKKYPYAMLGAMITVAGIVVAAVVTLAVSIITGMFLMYGQMRETSATQTVILSRLDAVQVQQKEDGNAMRAYEGANGKRIEFLVGLMTKDQQRAANEYDRSHPIPLMPRKQERE